MPCDHNDLYACTECQLQEAKAELARVREERDLATQALKEAMQRAAEQAKWIIDAQKDKERVARRAYESGYVHGMNFEPRDEDGAVAQAMREVKP